MDKFSVSFSGIKLSHKLGYTETLYPERHDLILEMKSVADIRGHLDKSYEHVQHLVVAIIPKPKKKRIKKRKMLPNPKHKRRKL